MFKKLVTFLFTIFISFSVSSQSLNDLSFGSDSTLEVVSWNIEWFPKNGAVTADSVSKIILALDVDILGLQEISDTALLRQVIDSLPGFKLYLDEVRHRGLAFVYKTDAITVQKVFKIYDTTPYQSPFPRSPIVMEFSYKGEDFVVINNHYKCCGNGTLNLSNANDEESRRHRANLLIKQYLDAIHPTRSALVIGDLNDILTDVESNNVFQMFLDDTLNYAFADMEIAQGPSSDWSFPGWPSHLDHILISNELFAELADSSSTIETISVDDYFTGGFNYYDNNISDHLPVGFKFKLSPSGLSNPEFSVGNPFISPNPTRSQFTINMKNFPMDSSIEIIDLYGKKIKFNQKRIGRQIDIKLNGPSGLYFVLLSSEHQKETLKILKQ